MTVGSKNVPRGEHGYSKSRQYLILAFLTLLAAAIRAFWLDHPTFWRDEIFTFVYTRESYAHHFALDRTSDVHPPLFTVMLKAWMGWFGDSRTATRALPVLFGALTLPAAFLIARNWLGMRIAILTGLFFALYPFNIHFSREIRAYGVFSFFTLWAFFFFLEMIRRRQLGQPVKLWHAVIFAVCLAATFHLHYLAILSMALFGLAGLLVAVQDRDWPLLVRLWAAILVSALLCVPQSFHFFGYATHEGAVRNAWIAPTDLRVFFVQTMAAIAFPSFSKIVVLPFYAFGAWRLWKLSRPLFIVTFVFVALGPLVFALVGMIKPIYLARSIAGVLVLLPMLLAVGVAGLGKRLQIAALVVLVPIHLWALKADYPPARLPNPGEAIKASVRQGGGETVYFDTELDLELKAYHVDASGWHSLGRRSQKADGRAIAEHLARCHARPGCPNTIVIIENDPEFDKRTGVAWNAMVDELARTNRILSNEVKAGYRIVTFQ